ncbi:MAG: M56 family metallopeptidase [Chloroflexi bacterium]|nr:M56 family metallopeptidase [Chloroflexota bacterium]
MSARQSLTLLGVTAAFVLAALGALVGRLAPCVLPGALCADPGVSSLCRLLSAAGIEVRSALLEEVLFAGVLLLPSSGLLAVVRRSWRTLAFLRSLRPRTVTPLPTRVGMLARATGLEGRIDLVDLPQPLAFVFGLARPRVCLSTGLIQRLDRRELWAVLEHERVHLTRRDPLRALLGHGLATLLFWLPLAHALAAHWQVAAEVEADAIVARQPEGRVALARALSKLLTVAPGMGMADPVAVSGLTATEQRITALCEREARVPLVLSTPAALVSALLVLALLCLLLL